MPPASSPTFISYSSFFTSTLSTPIDEDSVLPWRVSAFEARNKWTEDYRDRNDHSEDLDRVGERQMNVALLCSFAILLIVIGTIIAIVCAHVYWQVKAQRFKRARRRVILKHIPNLARLQHVLAQQNRFLDNDKSHTKRTKNHHNYNKNGSAVRRQSFSYSDDRRLSTVASLNRAASISGYDLSSSANGGSNNLSSPFGLSGCTANPFLLPPPTSLVTPGTPQGGRRVGNSAPATALVAGLTSPRRSSDEDLERALLFVQLNLNHQNTNSDAVDAQVNLAKVIEEVSEYRNKGNNFDLLHRLRKMVM